jgi:hypothetical protein
MKKIMLSLLGCLLSFQCFASCACELDGRLYIAPGSVYVAPDAIYVYTKDGFVPVQGIAVDDNGIYIQDFEGRRPGERAFLCARCNTVHTLSEKCPDKR